MRTHQPKRDLFIVEADARNEGVVIHGLNASSRCIGVSAIMDTAFFSLCQIHNPQPLSKFRGNAFAPLSLPLQRSVAENFGTTKAGRVSILDPQHGSLFAAALSSIGRFSSCPPSVSIKQQECNKCSVRYTETVTK